MMANDNKKELGFGDDRQKKMIKQQTKMPINFKVDNGFDPNAQNLMDDTSLDESIDFGKEEQD